MRSLFDVARASEFVDWRPPEFISLDGTSTVYLNFETSGLKWWERDRPIGFSLLSEDMQAGGYYPFGHHHGQNLDEDACRRYLKDNLRGKKIVNINTKFEVHHAREWGLDLEELGCTVSDVAHSAALLDDHRRRFALDVLVKDILNLEPMKRVDESRMADYAPGEVAERSCMNVAYVAQLEAIFNPELEDEDLMRVKQLEDEVIFAVAEMEKNAIPINVELLHQWHEEAEQRYLRYLWQIHRETGIRFNPGSSASWAELFRKLNIEWKYTTDTGQAAISDNLIKRVEHPTIQLARKAGKLQDLKSDYLDKYFKTVGSNGLLRFSLHQLRSDEGGTITGRFSGSAIKIGSEKIGCNPQQVPDIVKQIDKGHDPDFIIRKLFLFEASADAKQIEYRLFAHYAETPKVLEAYSKDPNLSFHKLIHGYLKPYVSISYEHQKNVNFMKIYAGGIAKLAFMLDFIDEQQFAELQKEYPQGVPRDHPLLTKAVEVNRVYERELPEVKPLLERASHVAKIHCDRWCRPGDELHEKYPHRGYVRTLLGRRQRFPDMRRLHKALNGIIQGGAADIMKQKMVEVHRERKRIGFKPMLTNHDELCGTFVDNVEGPRLLQEMLNVQSFPELKVPILWDVKTGHNWAEC